jgi:hypothetical protein
MSYLLAIGPRVPVLLEQWSSRQRGFLLALFVPLAIVVIADWRLRRQR